MSNEFTCVKLLLIRLLPNVTALFFTVLGSAILAWVGWLTWYDVTSWGKDIVSIFFVSRTGESISLGIGMKVIYYFLIGLTLLLSGLLTFLRRRNKVVKLNPSRGVPVQPEKEEKDPLGCPHHFGYLANRVKSVPIPQECLICPRIADCMVITVFIKRGKKGEIKLAS